MFSTGFFTDYRDGQSYATIDINGTTWLAQNLNYNNTESYCYEDDEKNCTDQGRLYTWESAQTACPKGWELPNQYEWEKVLRTLRETFYCKGCYEDFTLGGKSGFEASLSGLRRGEDGKFYDLNRNGNYWSKATPNDLSLIHISEPTRPY